MHSMAEYNKNAFERTAECLDAVETAIELFDISFLFGAVFRLGFGIVDDAGVGVAVGVFDRRHAHFHRGFVSKTASKRKTEE